MPLSDTKLRALKPKDKPFRVSDSGGLFIQTNPNGTKLWRMAYRFNGKQKALSFGPYPVVTLLEARQRRDEAKRVLRDGQDPALLKKEAKSAATSAPVTFKEIGERWFAASAKRWTPAYSSRLKSRLDSDVYSEIGDLPIVDLKPRDVLATIRKVEARGAIVMARRIYQMIGTICRFAVAESVIESDPTRDVGSALARRGKAKRRTAMKDKDLPEFFERLDAYEGEPVTKLAMKLIVHTFVRTNELRFATFSELHNLDGDKPEWRIPAERMKVDDQMDDIREEHIVPLSRQAAQYFRELVELVGSNGYLFPSSVFGKEGQPISGNTLIYCLYRLGYHGRATVHGFRSTASTVLNEHQFHKDWVEMQLAHIDSSIRGVYNAALYLPQRRKMMQWWSDYLEPPERNDSMFDDLLG